MTRSNPFCLLILFLVLLSGCSTAPKGSDGKELHKKLYLDANLEFTLTVPKEWTRHFLPAKVGDPGPYSVFWQVRGKQNELEKTPVSVEVTLLPNQDPLDEQALAKEFALRHPGFNSTALRPLKEVPFSTVELLGHTASRTYRVLSVRAPRHTYQISFSSLPETFEENQALFDLIFTSFSPIE